MVNAADEFQVAVVGLGYVGLPLFIALDRKFKTIGYDNNLQRINGIKNHHDFNSDLELDKFDTSELDVTTSIESLKNANVIIVTLPTPVDINNSPDLSITENFLREFATCLSQGMVIVFESTVFPGATQDRFAKVLEEVSGLKSGSDFGVAYSPERINPGDKNKNIFNIKKVIAADNEWVGKIVHKIYSSIIPVGVVEASSIKVAEASKLLENIQRDVNIALMNEFSIFCEAENITATEVISVAKTKWNFADYKPGLVGGHCIAVDPYYLIHKASTHSVDLPLISTARRINEDMLNRIFNLASKKLKGNQDTVTVIGVSFKPNVRDIRNSKIIGVIDLLKASEVELQICDPIQDPNELISGIPLTQFSRLKKSQVLIISAGHDLIKEKSFSEIQQCLLSGSTIIDIGAVLNRHAFEFKSHGYEYIVL
jgi:UDP-N-acetyl-D-glucosamine/UDP-N-acetyl-D-galactosamine dehydrogenase